MQTKPITALVFGAFVAMAGCAQEGHTPRQQTPNGKMPSPDVVLTDFGKSLTMIGAYPSKTAISGNHQSFGEGLKGSCSFESKAFTATAKFGTAIKLPAFGKNSPELVVTCDMGAKSYTKTLAPINLTQEAYRAQAAGHVLFGFGIVGAAVTGGMAANRDKEKDIYGYPTTITFSP